MTDQLRLYNDALLICGERFLASLTEDREPRRLLDQAWNSNAIQYCLEQAPWSFATRTQLIDYDTDASPTFGFGYRFNKPTDWVATSALCQDEFFKVPLTDYADEVDYFYASVSPIYLQYVSNDTNYGLAMGRWPQTFSDYVAAHLAGKIILKLTTDAARRDYILHPKEGLEARRLLTAQNKNSHGKPTLFPAKGRWVMARQTRGNQDLGSTTQLIG